ncbi:Blp family class II bacteriocin [Streptococcus ruminantium]|uniref:Blp family class II bacteriocin n=1 Tax=Streptococcus ruminantium TaxID=1917441 RepID=UPI001EFFEFC4|nr:Blp family class II bacteriocin [Streptococcus ruminantium]BDD42502.1 hypothetical protein GUT189_08350 [Streptococcus ruminantium]
MNTQVVHDFTTINELELSGIEGGKNNWQTNVWEGGSAAVSGWGFGSAVCGVLGVTTPLMPACGYIGAKFGVALWAGATGATGGF